MIQKDRVGDYFECVKPSRFELIAAVGIGLLSFFVISIPTLIRHLKLTHAQTILLDNIGHEVEKGLSKLDSLSFTNTVVTFLFWGIVGILIYGITTALVKLWQAGEENKELISEEYVHPEGFSKRHFWRQIVEKELFSAAILTAELIVISATIFWVFPFALVHIGSLFSGIAVSRLLFTALSLVIVGGVFCFGLIIFKAWRYRHILFII